MKYEYKIRAHHGMCIEFFQGKGYSNEFTAYMGGILQKLENNPVICITMETDAICQKCPNNRQGICETESKVAEYDRQVLHRCGLSEGMVMPYWDFKKTVCENILLPGKGKEICGNCQWSGICHWNAGGRSKDFPDTD